MIVLFRSLFSPHGPIYQYPKKSDLTGYEWCLDSDLDDSFAFLLEPGKELEEILESPSLFFAFLAGFFDAEGSVYYHKKASHGGFEFALANTREDLILRIAKRLRELGFTPKVRRERQQPSRGVVNGGEWITRLSIWRYDQVVRILKLLPLKHGEKVEKRQLALRLDYKADRKVRDSLIGEWVNLKQRIRNGRDECVRAAERKFENKFIHHPEA
jgi:hypothetical protein